MSDFQGMGVIREALVLSAASLEALGFEKVLSVVASLLFVGVFILQFFSVYRHGGRDAVVSMMTWVLVACLCAALAGYYWQQQRDFFQVVLLLILTGGAISCFLLSIIARVTLGEEAERRRTERGEITANRDDQVSQAIADMRGKIALARQRKGGGVSAG
jgi:uncharacterized protein involved in response to NO